MNDIQSKTRILESFEILIKKGEHLDTLIDEQMAINDDYVELYNYIRKGFEDNDLQGFDGYCNLDELDVECDWRYYDILYNYLKDKLLE